MRSIEISGGNKYESIEDLLNNCIHDNIKILNSFDKVIDINKLFSDDNIDNTKQDKFFPSIKDGKWPIAIIQIKNGVASHYTKNNKFYGEEFYDHNDNRIIDKISMINNAMKLYGPIKDTYVLFNIHDREPYELLNNKFPIFVDTKPINDKFILFPDITFLNLSISNKYGEENNYDWDGIKQLINDYEPEHIVNDIYFKGANTGQKRHNLRHYLSILQKDNVTIKLDAWENYEPIYKFKDHKALLNLPGHYDWSNRFKYLFLMNRVVININPIMINIEDKTDRYVTFIDLFVKPNIHYHDIDIKLKYIKLQGAHKFNKNNCFNLIKKLNKLNIDKMDNIYSLKGYNLINQLTMKHVYKYIHENINYIADNFKYIL